MKKLLSIKEAKILAVSVDIIFLFIHMALLWLFRRTGVTPMVYFNIASILFYIVLPVLVQKSYLRAFCIAVYVEVVLHMCTAVYFTGMESGFQITMIGMGILLYYSEYVGRYLKIPFLRATPLSLAGMAAYLLICVVDHCHTAAYRLPGDVAYGLHLAWALITFGVTIFYLYTFVRLSSGTEELLANEIDHDQLTGLPNRYYIWSHLNALDEEHRLEGHWIAMMDIDDFKSINDTYGHNCGDYILTELAAILQSNRMDAQACRWGGEEFILLGEIKEDFESCRRDLEALKEQIAACPFRFEDLTLKVTVTVGVAEYHSGSTVRDWIGAADQKLYVGKRSGKNKVEI